MVRRIRIKLTRPIDISHRDEQANKEVAQILAFLPADHLARLKFVEGRPTVDLQRLLADEHPELIQPLRDSMEVCDRRIREKHPMAPGSAYLH